jgi:cell division septum initiation protein DivIVA
MQEYFDENAPDTETVKLDSKVETLQEELANAQFLIAEYRRMTQQLTDRIEVLENPGASTESTHKTSIAQASSIVAVASSSSKAKDDSRVDDDYFDGYSWNGK